MLGVRFWWRNSKWLFPLKTWSFYAQNKLWQHIGLLETEAPVWKKIHLKMNMLLEKRESIENITSYWNRITLGINGVQKMEDGSSYWIKKKTYWKQSKLLKLPEKNKAPLETNKLLEAEPLTSEQAIEKIKNKCKQQKLLE